MKWSGALLLIFNAMVVWLAGLFMVNVYSEWRRIPKEQAIFVGVAEDRLYVAFRPRQSCRAWRTRHCLQKFFMRPHR